MLIALAGQFDPEVSVQLSVAHEVIPFDRSASRARMIEVLVTRGSLRVDKPLLEALPRLRLIVKAGSGLDSIDIEEAGRRGVAVLRTAGSARSVAEQAFALLFAVLRNVPAFDAAVRRGEWASKERFVGRLVSGRRLGVVGFGEIGREVAELGAGLGMSVHVHDRSPERPEKAATIQRLGITLCGSLDELLSRSDVLSLHVPDEGARLLDEAALARLPAGAILINTARAGLVDQAALLAALAGGRLAGAGLDVHPDEEKDAPDPLRQLENVVLSPHVGAQSVEARAEIGRRIVSSVQAFTASVREHEPCAS